MYLRVSLTDRCNLRCRYCLPAHPRFAPERASGEEIRALTRLICAEIGVDKIRLTGGEPSLVADLVEHVQHAATLTNGNVGLTSNGVHLEPLLNDLREAGLTKLNISLDAADAASFERITRRDEFSKVLSTIRAAKALGYAPLKINAVALPETDAAALLALAIAEGVHLRFIELMDIGDLLDHRRHYVDADQLRQQLFEAGYSLFEDADRDEPTSRVWTVAGVDPRHCSLGFITTSSAPFCATCDRLRLTSQGTLFNCLFDQRGVDLLEPLRAGDDGEARRRIRAHVSAKAAPAHFVRRQVMAGIGG
ncbi:MAG: GTP 3',8-cyclase MoaA [Planctomycetota bacterium]|jgi:cyclic pyranopterin phosphate synthase